MMLSALPRGDSAPDSALRVRWCERFADLPAAAVALVEVPALPAWSIAALRAQDHHPASHVEALCYAVAYQGDRIVGWVAAAVVPLFDAVLTQGVRLRALSLGDGVGFCAPPIVVAPGHPEPWRVHTTILRAAIDRARDLGLDGIFLYTVPHDQRDLIRALDGLGFFRWNTPPCAFVPLLIESMGPYPSALRSSYRSVLKKKQRELDALGVRIVPGPAGLDASDLYTLYRGVAEKKESEWADLTVLDQRLTAGFFAEALSVPDFRIHTAIDPSDRALAYVLAVRCGELVQSLVVGMDREALQRLGGETLPPAVYQALHVTLLRAAESEGCRWANLGITAEAGKARLGALFRPADEADYALTPAFADLLARFSAAYSVPPLPHCRPYGDAALATQRAASAGFLLTAGEETQTGRDER